MQTLDITLAVASALALGGMAFVAPRVWRRGSPRARLCGWALVVGALFVVGALLALALGASRYDTGRFLVGMSVGVALGLPLGCAIILLADRAA